MALEAIMARQLIRLGQLLLHLRLPENDAVKLTANFEANLLAIESFWGEAGAPQRYAHLLDELLDTVIPTLEGHPRIGRPFLELEVRLHAAAAVEQHDQRDQAGCSICQRS
jgi:hypothetical protein